MKKKHISISSILVLCSIVLAVFSMLILFANGISETVSALGHSATSTRTGYTAIFGGSVDVAGSLNYSIGGNGGLITAWIFMLIGTLDIICGLVYAALINKKAARSAFITIAIGSVLLLTGCIILLFAKKLSGFADNSDGYTVKLGVGIVLSAISGILASITGGIGSIFELAK